MMKITFNPEFSVRKYLDWVENKIKFVVDVHPPIQEVKEYLYQKNNLGAEYEKNKQDATEFRRILIFLSSVAIVLFLLVSLFIQPNVFGRIGKDITKTSTKIVLPTLRSSTSVSNNYVLGVWYDGSFSTTKTITKIGQVYQVTNRYNDGGSETITLISFIIDGQLTLIEHPESTYGDYMVIKPNGYLAFYDNQGLIDELPPK